MPLHVGPLSEHQEILEAVERAHAEGRLDPEETARSLGRIRRFSEAISPHDPTPTPLGARVTRRFWTRPRAARSWRLGGFEALEPTPCLVVWAENTAGGAASDVTKPPVERLIDELTAQGFTPIRAPYSRDALGEGRSSILEMAARKRPLRCSSQPRGRAWEKGRGGWGSSWHKLLTILSTSSSGTPTAPWICPAPRSSPLALGTLL